MSESRPTYTAAIRDRSKFVTRTYSRTGPDVIFAIEEATTAHLAERKLELNAEVLSELASAKDQAEHRTAVLEAAKKSCKYVNKTNVPRCLEAHALQLAEKLEVPAPPTAPTAAAPAEEPKADAAPADDAPKGEDEQK
jgi:hypothetical protein